MILRHCTGGFRERRPGGIGELGSRFQAGQIRDDAQ